jgi:hypothetical protein
MTNKSTILVRYHSHGQIQGEYFFVDENGKLDLSEVGLLFGSPLYEAGI